MSRFGTDRQGWAGMTDRGTVGQVGSSNATEMQARNVTVAQGGVSSEDTRQARRGWD